MTGSRARVALGSTLALVVAAAVVAHALQKPLDHDEHQFVASAALIARDGLLPFRDFPYFHLPYLSFVYAPVFLVTDRLLASARVVAALAALAIAGLVWARARDALSSLPALARDGGAALFVLALVTNPLFLYTAGRAWNHDVAILPALGAAWMVGAITTAARPARSALVAGLLVGLAAGTRSTMVLLAPALLVATLLAARGQRIDRPARVAAALVGGAVIALLPLVVMLWLAPAEFVYGNLTYNLTLNPLYRARMGYDEAMSEAQKLDYLLGTVLRHPRMAALVLAYVVSGVALLATKGRALRARAPALTIALCLPFLLVAALVPTPTWYQYYYALVPFLLIGTLANFAALETTAARAIAALAAAPMLAGALTGARYYLPVATAAPSAWTALAVHEVGTRIAAEASGGRVLTLGPTYALEGKLPIFPALATGPFQWRTAPLVEPSKRLALGLLGPDELDALAANPELTASLTGIERDPAENLEAPLLAFVERHGWEAKPLAGDLTLWLRPTLAR